MNEISVGTGYVNYSVERAIVNKVSGFTYHNTYDINIIKAALLQKTPISGQDYKHIFSPHLSTPRFVDFYHLFNAVCLQKDTQKPWITSFETIAPRLSILLSEHKKNDPDYKKFKSLVGKNSLLARCLENIASHSCKRLIALSANALKIQDDFFESLDFYNRFDKEKLIYLHPPQKVLLKEGKVFSREKVHFLFVGKDFFRKGGYEALSTLANLKNHYKLPICFTIIGSIKEEWFGNTSSDQIKATHRLLKENKDWVTHYTFLPNKDVLKLMKEVDVGILPTWSDSFGYSVLEMQASGVPVITTDVRALPEINNNQCGWIINLPKNRYGELMDVESRKMGISQMICEELDKFVREIFKQPSDIRRKSEASILRIKQFHDPTKYSAQLESIYNDTLNLKCS